MNLAAINAQVSGLIKIGGGIESLRIESWESKRVSIVERSSLEIKSASSSDWGVDLVERDLRLVVEFWDILVF